ncbi:hypothetical protein DIPPA_33552 [Diplonema papillatum]|nr:hypothetical protein DIPPA_33552 [Diplonema papillatum]
MPVPRAEPPAAQSPPGRRLPQRRDAAGPSPRHRQPRPGNADRLSSKRSQQHPPAKPSVHFAPAARPGKGKVAHGLTSAVAGGTPTRCPSDDAWQSALAEGECTPPRATPEARVVALRHQLPSGPRGCAAGTPGARAMQPSVLTPPECGRTARQPRCRPPWDFSPRCASPGKPARSPGVGERRKNSQTASADPRAWPPPADGSFSEFGEDPAHPRNPPSKRASRHVESPAEACRRVFCALAPSGKVYPEQLAAAVGCSAAVQCRGHPPGSTARSITPATLRVAIASSLDRGSDGGSTLEQFFSFSRRFPHLFAALRAALSAPASAHRPQPTSPVLPAPLSDRHPNLCCAHPAKAAAFQAKLRELNAEHARKVNDVKAACRRMQRT